MATKEKLIDKDVMALKCAGAQRSAEVLSKALASGAVTRVPFKVQLSAVGLRPYQ